MHPMHIWYAYTSVDPYSDWVSKRVTERDEYGVTPAKHLVPL